MVRETYRPPPWSGRDGWHIVVPGAYLVKPSYTETNETPFFFSSNESPKRSTPSSGATTATVL